MNIKELKAKREELTNKMSELAGTVRGDAQLSDEQRAEFDSTSKKVKDIDADITRLEELRSLQESTAVEVLNENVEDENIELRNFIQGKEVRSQTVGTNSAGGYTVGASVASKVIETIKSTNGMIENAGAITTATGTELSYPTLDDTDNEATITSETDARRNGPDVEFGSITLKSFTYDSGIIKISNELVQDSSVNIEQIVINALSKRIARKLQKDFTLGTGTTEPSGIITQTIAGVTSANTDISADELLELQFSMDEEYAKNGKYMMNNNTFLAVRKLKDGQGNYLVKGKTLHDKPIIINNNMSDIISGAKPVLFGDFSQYLVRNVKGINVFKFNELYQETNEIGFKASARFDGTLLQPLAVKHLEIA